MKKILARGGIEFIGHTITIYGGYTDDCGHHFVDSLKVRVVDNE